MKSFVLAVAVAAACLPVAALADIAPPDLDGCRDKKVGDGCKRDDGSAGTCTKDTCYRNDYSKGVPPSSKPYDCIRCLAPEKSDTKEEKKSDAGSEPWFAFGLGGLVLLVGVGVAWRAGRSRRSPSA